MKSFLAKPDQTYAEHLQYVYSAWQQTIAAKQHLIERIAQQYDFSYHDFVKASLLTIAFHDIGKMIMPFQEMMEAIRTDTPFNVKRNYRHELVSLLYVLEQLTQRQWAAYKPLILLGALAVAGHHRALNSDLTSFERERVSNQPQRIHDGITEAFSLAEALFRSEGWSLSPNVNEAIESADPYKTLAQVTSGLHKFVDQEGLERSRTVYALLKGILHYADWHGSGMAPVHYTTDVGSAEVIQHIRDRCREKGIHYGGLKQFQQACGDHDGNLITIAPTGSGKTEASLLWALTNVQIMRGAKILYLLPTMVTANSIWRRLAEIFGWDTVGLTHSTANLCKQSDVLELGEEDQWETRRSYLFDQTFIKPITVATVDQLLTTGFNSGRWTVKEVNAANAVIVIDEIHSYDEWTLGLIVAAIRHFSALGARFLLMSATLPTHICSLLVRALPDATVITDDTLAHEIRSSYFVKDGYIENDLDAISHAVKEGKRVLVVVNTVAHCQYLAEQLRELEPLCYHSHFILKDRKRIEEAIPHTKLLVATQVVEVSLDIDFDWLFTECAPADAITQRAGRVNRYRDKERDSRVFIYKASRTSERIYDPINSPPLLEATYAVFDNTIQQKGHDITELDLLTIVETVYSTFDIEKRGLYIDATHQYDVSQRRRIGVFDSRLREDKEDVTRHVDYETDPALPLCFKEEVLRVPPAERRWYEVRLPRWYVAQAQKRTVIEGITFCDVAYDPFLGALLRGSF